MTEITYYFYCQIQKFKICNLSVVYLKIVFCCFPVLLVWHIVRLVTWNLEGKEARGMGQYLFEYIASHCKTPVPNTLGSRFCSLYIINVCKSRRCWSILSCQAEIPTYIICIPYTLSKFQLSLTAYWPCYGFEMCERNKVNFVEILLHWMHVIYDKMAQLFTCVMWVQISNPYSSTSGVQWFWLALGIRLCRGMKISQHSIVIMVTIFRMKESGGYWRLYGWLGSQLEGSYQGHKERNWNGRE